MLEFQRCEFEDLSGLINLTSLKQPRIEDCNKLEALPNLQELADLEELNINRCPQLKDLRGILGLQSLKLLVANGYRWLHENLGSDVYQLTSLQVLRVCNGGFKDLQGLATCSQLHSLDCSRCPIRELPDLSNFPELFWFWLEVRDCVNLKKLTCTRPLSPKLEHLDVHGCMRLQALPDLTNSLKMRVLNISNSGVLLNA